MPGNTLSAVLWPRAHHRGRCRSQSWVPPPQGPGGPPKVDKGTEQEGHGRQRSHTAPFCHVTQKHVASVTVFQRFFDFDFQKLFRCLKTRWRYSFLKGHSQKVPAIQPSVASIRLTQSHPCPVPCSCGHTAVSTEGTCWLLLNA